MQDNPTGNDNIESSPKVCIRCGNPAILKDFPNPLCSECRTYLIKFPIPLWVKLFAGAILILVIFSLINLPENLSIGITYEKGIHAEKERKFFTAQQYFQQTVKAEPSNTEAKAHLLIAAFYNNDLLMFDSMAGELSEKQFDDDDLLDQVDGLFTKAQNSFPADSFYSLITTYSDQSLIPDTAMNRFLTINPGNVYAQLVFASNIFNKGEYKKCDSLLQHALDKDPENMTALGIMSSVKRMENQPDSAVYYAEKILQQNNEMLYARCLKARALLKMKKNNEGLLLAFDCVKEDSTDMYAQATLALAYHFNNNTIKRDAVIHQYTGGKDTSAMAYFRYVLDVISNKEPF